MSNPLPFFWTSNRRRRKRLAFLVGTSIVAAIFSVVISCSTVNQTMVTPPQIPGATFVGSETCATCHDEVVQNFKRTNHGMYLAENAAESKGCESCHGPGSVHVEKGGGKGAIINPKKSPKTCYTCHQRVLSEFSLQYHHPLPEGRMTCSDCHSVHEPPKAGIQHVPNDTCFKCHQQIRGPWTFEHEPVEHEGCTACHNAHGSINTRMLTERDYNLCLKCHYSRQYQSVGHYAHRRALNPANVEANGRYALCIGCHRGVHGSNFSKELRTQ